MPCATGIRTADMTQAALDSFSSLTSTNTVIGVGNNYRGMWQWPNSTYKAVAGVMYTADTKAAKPILYKALRSGSLGAFPAVGTSNADWQYIGLGYPVINDLYHSGRRIFEWNERNSAAAQVGDIFVYNNPYTQDTEYFRLLKTGAGYFPTDKSSNDYWSYIGRHFIQNEPLKQQTYGVWGSNNRLGRVGTVYQSGSMLFRLKTAAQYWYFPTSAVDNTWWQFIGYTH